MTHRDRFTQPGGVAVSLLLLLLLPGSLRALPRDVARPEQAMQGTWRLHREAQLKTFGGTTTEVGIRVIDHDHIVLIAFADGQDIPLRREAPKPKR